MTDRAQSVRGAEADHPVWAKAKCHPLLKPVLNVPAGNTRFLPSSYRPPSYPINTSFWRAVAEDARLSPRLAAAPSPSGGLWAVCALHTAARLLGSRRCLGRRASRHHPGGHGLPGSAFLILLAGPSASKVQGSVPLPRHGCPAECRCLVVLTWRPESGEGCPGKPFVRGPPSWTRGEVSHSPSAPPLPQRHPAPGLL